MIALVLALAAAAWLVSPWWAAEAQVAPSPPRPPGLTCPGREGDARRHVVGTPGPDVLRVVGRSAAVVCGLEGDDRIVVGPHAGISVLEGGAGDDVLCARNRSRETLNGGPGADRYFRDPFDSLVAVEGPSRRCR